MGPDNTIQFAHACVHKLFTSVRIEQQQTVKDPGNYHTFSRWVCMSVFPQKDAQWAFLFQ